MRSPTARSAPGSSQPEAGNTGSGAIGVRAATALGALLLASGHASAFYSDQLELWASQNVTHDSNVLRLSQHVDPASVGAQQLGDTFFTTKIGIAADLPLSLQRFQAAYTWQATRFHRFTNLDFRGHLATLGWRWVIDHRFDGTMGYNDSKGLASFSNIQRNAQDLVTTRQAYASGNWKVTPTWRASARLDWGKSEHSDALRSVNNIEAVSAELALAYLTQQDNSVAGTVRAEHGKRPPTADLGGLAINNTYRQTGAGVTTAWLFTPHSRFDGNIFLVHRAYDEDTRRNFSGVTGRALYTWTPTPKVTVVGAVFRDIGPAEDVTTAFVLATGAYLRPKWDMTEKISLQGNVEYDRWDYRGEALLGGNFSNRLRAYGVSLMYKPTRKSLVNAGLNRETRTSDLLLGDYDAKVAFIEARIGF